jgi:hypothetical protein
MKRDAVVVADGSIAAGILQSNLGPGVSEAAEQQAEIDGCIIYCIQSIYADSRVNASTSSSIAFSILAASVAVFTLS